MHTRGSQPLVVGDHDGESAVHQRRYEDVLVADADVQAAGIVDALVDHLRRRALGTHALGGGSIGDQRPGPLPRPWVVRFEVGARYRGPFAAVTVVHEPRAGRPETSLPR